MIKEGKIKKQKPFLKIGEDEKPFKLPEGWEWARIGEIGHDWGQKKPDKDFTYIEVSGIDNAAGIVKSPKRLPAAGAPSRARKIVKFGTIIYSTVRPYLQNICVIDQKYSPEPIASTAFAILHPFQQMPGVFFTSYLRSPTFVSYVESVQTGIAYPAINDKQFFGGLVPIPPRAEQHRIVAKVDELMALCDQLEQQQTDSNATHQTLVETLLSTLTDAADQREFAEAWQRIADHFGTLFTTEQSIDHLKQTILQLAVMGKLVPQDPNDEPASVSLEKIAKEKARLIKEGKIKKQKPLPEIGEDEKPFELPEGWEWVRLRATGIGSTGKTPNTRYPKYYNGPVAFLGPGQITVEGDITDSQKTLTKEGCECSAIAKAGDILMVCIGGSIGKSAIVLSKVAFNQQINCIHPFFVDSKYLNISMKTLHFQTSILDAAAGSATPIINRSKWEDLLVVLPPLAEQHRIVAKVDELMAICDTLKARLKDSQATQVQLANAIVEKAVA